MSSIYRTHLPNTMLLPLIVAFALGWYARKVHAPNESQVYDRPLPSTGEEYKYQVFRAASQAYIDMRNKSAVACQEFNALSEDSAPSVKGEYWSKICPYSPNKTEANLTQNSENIRELLPGQDVPIVKGPIYIDYGFNVKIHPSVFINRGVIIHDTPNSTIEVGENSVIASGCKLIAVDHPRDIKTRKKGLRKSESGGRSIKIGKGVHICVDAIILPGTVIGDYCIVTAKSVVNGVIPPRKFTDGKIVRDLPKKFA